MNSKIGKDIQKAAALLAQGELVAIPTETVYGLAANALDESAVKRIFETKNRPAVNPLVVHVADISQIERYVTSIPLSAEILINKFCPGPLTIVLPRKTVIPGIVTAGREAVAIRIPAHPVALDLLRKANIPLAAPSANPSGYISPTKPEHVLKNLGDKISYILDGGECQMGIESTIIGFNENVPVIYRQGIITENDIKANVGEVKHYSGLGILAPGMSIAHYSPNTPLVLTDDVASEIEKHKNLRIGVLAIDGYSSLLPAHQQILLAKNGDMYTAAKNLYAAMHSIDEQGYDMIIAQKFPETGIGRP